jgi:predicted RNA-binding Zn ribbon-like protein
MAVAQQSKPKWVDPDTMWDDDAPAGDVDNVIEMARPESSIDRFHNHEDLSPEAMAKAISDLQASVEALDSRLAAVEGDAAGASNATKDLGSSMFKMGDALSKRVKAIEDSVAALEVEPEAEPDVVAEEAPMFAPIAKPAAKDRRLVITLGLVAALIVSVAAVALMQPQLASHQAAPAEALYAPTAPAGR